MEQKPFQLGLLVGRFQTLHLGHADMIGTATALCSRTAVFIGSSQEAGTLKNPFSYEMRKKMLQTVFGEAIEIYPLPDIGVGNNAVWGDYVLRNVRERCGRLPDLLVSGKEERRISWFDGTEGLAIAELYIPKTIDISATALRECFLRDDQAQWRQFTDPRLWDQYETLRQAVLAAKDNLNTSSI